MNHELNLIELSVKEVVNKPIFLGNSATGSVWKLSIQDEKIMVDVPNFSFQIFPLSPNKFKPVNTEVNLEIEFEKTHQNNPLLMHLYAKGIKRATFEALPG